MFIFIKKEAKEPKFLILKNRESIYFLVIFMHLHFLILAETHCRNANVLELIKSHCFSSQLFRTTYST